MMRIAVLIAGLALTNVTAAHAADSPDVALAQEHVQTQQSLAPSARAPWPAQKCAGLTDTAPALAQDRLLISVKIAADGMMGQPALVQSSGDGDLDQKMLACAAGHAYVPTIVAGKPAEAVWVMGYYPLPPGSGFAPAAPEGTPAETCANRFLSLLPEKLPPGAATKLSYRIARDGSVTDVVVTQSSGTPHLDDVSIRCVSSWHFFPVYRDGQPVEVDKVVSMQWQRQ